jgi:hypothetical protein
MIGSTQRTLLELLQECLLPSVTPLFRILPQLLRGAFSCPQPLHYRIPGSATAAEYGGYIWIGNSLVIPSTPH